MREALDEWIHDYFSGLASDKNNEGAKSQVAFILEHGGKSDLDRIFAREHAGEHDYYFLVPEQGWDHCFVGDIPTAVNFCLAILRNDPDKIPTIIAACLLNNRSSPLDSSEEADLMESFQDNPEWIEDPETWGWVRCDRVADVPSIWWGAIKEFFGRRGAAGIKATTEN